MTWPTANADWIDLDGIVGAHRLIAEELDVELDQVKVDPGPPSPAYWNTALADEAAAFMAPGTAEQPEEGQAHGFSHR